MHGKALNSANEFCVFRAKSDSVTQRSVYQKNEKQKKKQNKTKQKQKKKTPVAFCLQNYRLK